MLEFARRHRDSSLPLSISKSVNVSKFKSIEELVTHPVIIEAEDIHDFISSHVVEDALETLAVQEDYVGPPLRSSSLLPSGITQSSEVVEELGVVE